MAGLLDVMGGWRNGDFPLDYDLTFYVLCFESVETGRQTAAPERRQSQYLSTCY